MASKTTTITSDDFVTQIREVAEKCSVWFHDDSPKIMGVSYNERDIDSERSGSTFSWDHISKTITFKGSDHGDKTKPIVYDCSNRQRMAMSIMQMVSTMRFADKFFTANAVNLVPSLDCPKPCAITKRNFRYPSDVPDRPYHGVIKFIETKTTVLCHRVGNMIVRGMDPDSDSPNNVWCFRFVGEHWEYSPGMWVAFDGTNLWSIGIVVFNALEMNVEYKWIPRNVCAIIEGHQTEQFTPTDINIIREAMEHCAVFGDS